MPEREFFGHPTYFQRPMPERAFFGANELEKSSSALWREIRGLTLPAFGLPRSSGGCMKTRGRGLIKGEKGKKRKKKNSGQAAGADLSINSPARGRTMKTLPTADGSGTATYPMPSAWWPKAARADLSVTSPAPHPETRARGAYFRTLPACPGQTPDI